MFSKMQYERLGISLKVLGNCELNKHQFMMVCCSSNIKHTYQLAIARRGNVQSRFCGLWGEGWGQDRSVGVRTHCLPRDSGEHFFVQTRHFLKFGYFSLALNDEVLILGIGFIKSCFDLLGIGSLRKQLISGVGKPRCDWTWRRWIWLHWNQLTWMLRTEASWFFQHFLTFEKTISFNSQHGINALVHLMGSVVK